MLGFPGSGKSYVSAWLSPLYQAVHVRTDDLRLAIFGKDREELHDAMHKKQVNGAMFYVARQVLTAKHSVIYDANNNRYQMRANVSKMAKNLDAVPIVVWVQTPLEIVKKRVIARELAGGHKIFNPHFVDKMAARLEKPSNEPVIIIDGTQNEAVQQASFQEQLTKLKI